MIYEWRAAPNSLLVQLLPDAIRLRGNPLEPLSVILSRIPRHVTFFAFHLGVANSRHFPLCRTELIATLESQHISLLNSQAADLSRQSVSLACRHLGIGYLEIGSSFNGLDDVLMVKQIDNSGSALVALVDSANTDLGKAPFALATKTCSYRILSSRTDLPLWWNDPAMLFLNPFRNSRSIQYHCYLAGNHQALVGIQYESKIISSEGKHGVRIACSSKKYLETTTLHPLQSNVQDCLMQLKKEMYLDFGAITFVLNDTGIPFISTVSTMPVSVDPSTEFLCHLRKGLAEFAFR